MACEHKRLRCTNGVFYCLDCAVKVDAPAPAKAPEEAKETTADRPKRRAKKGAEK